MEKYSMDTLVGAELWSSVCVLASVYDVNTTPVQYTTKGVKHWAVVINNYIYVWKA